MHKFRCAHTHTCVYGNALYAMESSRKITMVAWRVGETHFIHFSLHALFCTTLFSIEENNLVQKVYWGWRVEKKGRWRKEYLLPYLTYSRRWNYCLSFYTRGLSYLNVIFLRITWGKAARETLNCPFYWNGNFQLNPRDREAWGTMGDD